MITLNFFPLNVQLSFYFTDDRSEMREIEKAYLRVNAEYEDGESLRSTWRLDCESKKEKTSSSFK